MIKRLNCSSLVPSYLELLGIGQRKKLQWRRRNSVSFSNIGTWNLCYFQNWMLKLQSILHGSLKIAQISAATLYERLSQETWRYKGFSEHSFIRPKWEMARLIMSSLLHLPCSSNSQWWDHALPLTAYPVPDSAWLPGITSAPSREPHLLRSFRLYLLVLYLSYCNLFPDKMTTPISPPFKWPLK